MYGRQENSCGSLVSERVNLYQHKAYYILQKHTDRIRLHHCVPDAALCRAFRLNVLSK